MIPQTPAQGIMLTGKYDDSQSYRINCECTDLSHTVDMWIEVQGDKDVNCVTLEFYVITQTPYWKKGFNRVKAAWDVLTKGYHESENHLILNKQAAVNLSTTISTAVKELENGD